MGSMEVLNPSSWRRLALGLKWSFSRLYLYGQGFVLLALVSQLLSFIQFNLLFCVYFSIFSLFAFMSVHLLYCFIPHPKCFNMSGSKVSGICGMVGFAH